MHLRDVTPHDLDAYLRMRCDPVMMAHLGGPLPREGMADKVRRDVEQAAADRAWIKMIVPDPDNPTDPADPNDPTGPARRAGAPHPTDPAHPGTVAGTVTLWSHDTPHGPMSEIGWMVLPEFQGQGLAKRAVRALLAQAREQDRWGTVHAFPATANAPSNGICRSLGFRFVAETEVDFAGRTLRVNHWTVDPRRAPLP
ncbi:GNAT family N-acetyltransferase [Streptomyces sp. NPDC005435]|uniref:GNAT family N-acetyltransferase n=1 Tax=Streptomyces sp. NPDC005435 TaxID=3154464 RepID=UPI003455B77D